MKIKPSRLREIIQEEVSQFNSKMSAPPDDITGEPDDEGAMARSQLLKLAKYSAALMDMMNDDTQLPAWVQAKITKSASYLGAVKHFIEGELELNEDKQQMKISRQKLESIIKQEVLKEMRMNENEKDDPDSRVFIPKGFREDLKNNKSIKNSPFDPELVYPGTKNPSPMKELLDNNKNKENEFVPIDRETRKYMIDQLSELLNMQQIDEEAQELLNTFFSGPQKQMELSGLNEEKQQMKISKQKLERIIREEVLKEMGMRKRKRLSEAMPDDDDPMGYDREADATYVDYQKDQDEEQGLTNEYDTKTERAMRAALRVDIGKLAEDVQFQNLRTVGKYIVHLPFGVDGMPEEAREQLRTVAYDAANTVNKREVEVEIATDKQTRKFKRDNRESW